jgi:hypothetical protein
MTTFQTTAPCPRYGAHGGTVTVCHDRPVPRISDFYRYFRRPYAWRPEYTVPAADAYAQARTSFDAWQAEHQVRRWGRRIGA